MMKVSIERATKWSKIHLCFCELSSAPTAPALAAARPVFLFLITAPGQKAFLYYTPVAEDDNATRLLLAEKNSF